MSAPGVAENVLEIAVLDWLGTLGYEVTNGPIIAPGELLAARASYSDVILRERLRNALQVINSNLPQEAIDETVRRITHPETVSLIENNRRFHQQLADGVEVEYRRSDGSIAGALVKLIDLENPSANDWLAVNQFTVVEGKSKRRADVIIFINGLPLVLFELKNPADENATIRDAFHQLQTYKAQVPTLLSYNELLIISDGVLARLGTLSSDWERFMAWRSVDGEHIAPKGELEVETLIKGICEQSRLLDLIHNFVVFETVVGEPIKKVAAYHQFFAVNKALDCTLRASKVKGDKRAGVIWHTQGSGKSLSMVFYAGKLILDEAMQNPTVVVLTDRIDLDGQLFGTFSRCERLLRQTPVQAEKREDLETLLHVSSGGVVFTTIQKFFPQGGEKKYPMLSDRHNIIVIADEAHRSQYDFIDGFARHMRDALPNATFIGFTGTPIESGDRSTPAVFGDYIDVYDIQRAVEDHATVPIYYEGRLAKLELKPEERPKIDPDFEEVTEGEEVESKEKLKSKWARLEAMVGTDKRIGLIAQDIVDHLEKRLEALEGKAMIVCMSRRICVDLYAAIAKLRPSWGGEHDEAGLMKVIMTGSASDGIEWQQHIRNKARRDKLADRFRDVGDSFKIVIVRDMWLTGFDAPSLHTMYIDKPMKGHGLMQAIARVNRVFQDKPGGLIVDYLGLAEDLKRAMADYTQAGGKGETVIDQEQAVAKMEEKLEVLRPMLHGFDGSAFYSGTPGQRVTVLRKAANFILAKEENDEPGLKDRFLKSVSALSRAFALSVPHPEAIAVRDEVGYLQAVRSTLVKGTVSTGQDPEMLDAAVKQIVSRAIASDEVIDIFSAAGMKQPNISLLSDEFLQHVARMPERNLAIEALRKFLNEEIKTRSKKNLVASRSFAAKLEESINKYQNRSITSAEILARLVEIAEELRRADKRGDELHLNEQELAFYDALGVNDAAVKVMGDEVLCKIAQELVDTIRTNVTIDWTVKEGAKAKLRVMVKRILRRYEYPPDREEQATVTVLQQAELLSDQLAA